MKKQKNDTIKIGTYFDADTEIHGDVYAKRSVKVDGNIRGDLHTLFDVVIGDDSVIEGDVTGRDIIVHGRIKGNVKASETITLTNNGVIEGDLTGTGLIVDIGSEYKGKCTIVRKNEGAPQGPEKIEKKTLEACDKKADEPKAEEEKAEASSIAAPKEETKAEEPKIEVAVKRPVGRPRKITIKELEPETDEPEELSPRGREVMRIAPAIKSNPVGRPKGSTKKTKALVELVG